jgi:hypothetical protein
MAKASFAHLAALLVPTVVFTAVLAPRWGTSTDDEIRRLRRHFATVEAELLARDVSQLTPAQRAARARHVETLRAYARSGVFPKNTDYPGRRTPYFIDRYGTRCAMAHLIEQSGHGDYVQRVSAKMNNAYISEIARDSALAGPLFEWLEENGLTVEEAARIQPAYCDGGLWFGPGPPPPCPPGSVRNPNSTPTVSTGYKVGTGMTVAGGITTIVLSRSLVDWGMSRRTAGWLGVTAGALGLALGVPALDDAGDSKTWGAVNTGAGALALIIGLEAALSGAPRQIATAAPWAPAQGGAGVVLSVNF